MRSASLNGVNVVTGTVLEKSANMHTVDNRNTNIGTLYMFIVLETDDGEIIRVNNLVADAHSDQHLNLGTRTTLYLKPIRHMSNFKKINLALAAVSENGVGITDLPLSLIMAQFFLALFGGIIVGGFFGFLAAALLSTFLGKFGAFLGILLAVFIPAYCLYGACKFASARNMAGQLRRQLLGVNGSGDTYRGVVVKNV